MSVSYCIITNHHNIDDYDLNPYCQKTSNLASVLNKISILLPYFVSHY